MFRPAEDKVTVSSGWRDLRSRGAILLPDPAVNAAIDDLEVSAVDILVECTVRCIASVDVRRDIAAEYPC